MFEFLKRHKIKDRAALRQSLVDRGHSDVPHHDSEDFDSILPTLLTMEVASELTSHFEPIADTPSIDVDSGFDPGGGLSGGGGADGSW